MAANDSSKKSKYEKPKLIGPGSEEHGPSASDDGAEPPATDAVEHATDAGPSDLTPELIADLHLVANHARIFLGPKFGSLGAGQRTVAHFQDMKRLGDADLDVDVKNHLITMGFFDLSRVLLGYTYGHDFEQVSDVDAIAQELARAGEQELAAARRPREGWPDANFCAFGTWASLTIGRNVRNRFAPRRLDNTTSNAIRGAVSRLAIDMRQTNQQRLSRLLGAAQQVVFTELVNAVEGLIDQTAHLESNKELRPDFSQAENKADLLAELAVVEKLLGSKLEPRRLIGTTEPKTARPGRNERYDDLQHGLLSYFLARQLRPETATQQDAAQSPDLMKMAMRSARSELIFRGNVLIESYVQLKVQQVLDYSVDEIASDYFSEQIGIEASENRGAGRWRRRLNRSSLKSFERRLGDVWPRFVTDQILVARVGEEIIRLGRDLPDPPDSTSFFPPELEHLDDNWASNLVLRFDHSFGHGVGTRSHNWRVYDDRMSWLVNLLRSRQRAGGVWRDPFTPEEEVAVRAHQDPAAHSPGGLSWIS